MSSYRLSQAARADLLDVLTWTADRFGDDARDRYRALIQTALRDVASDPDRAGSRSRPELGEGVRTWHLRLSRARSSADPVRQPRHFVIYRVDGDVVVIARLLHDMMDLAAHVDSETTWD